MIRTKSKNITIDQESNKKRYFQFLIIVLAAGSIYPLIYLRTSYQETILQVFDITLQQMNSIYTILGIIFVLGYFPSGYLADRFSAKKLLFISLAASGLTGIWFAQVPNYGQVITIFILWGIFSVFTFWSAHLKLVKMLAKPSEESKFFGILDGGRGVVEAVLAVFATIIFTTIVGTSTDQAVSEKALIYIIYMYSGVLLLMSLLVMVFLTDDKKIKRHSTELSTNHSNSTTQTTSPKNKITKQDFKKTLGNKFVWLMGGIIFMSYIVTWAIYYLGGFLETSVGASSSTVSVVILIALWMRPIGGILGGIFADKFKRTNVLNISLAVASAILIFISIISPSLSPYLFYIFIILLSLFIYAVRGVYWSLLGEFNIDKKVLGLTIGVISFIGYLPDILLPLISNLLFNQFGDVGGYDAYFIMSGIFGVLAIGLVFVFKNFQKTHNKNAQIKQK